MNKQTLTLGGWCLLALCSAAPVYATTFYVDPVGGSMSGDGSISNPWSTLQEVFANNLIESQKPAVYPYNGTLTARNPGAPVQPGDTIKLLSGDHGTIDILGWYNASTITIEAATGETPVLQKWRLRGGKNWALKNLTVSPEPYGTPVKATLVGFENHGYHGPSTDCSIEDSEIYTIDDISGWLDTDWTSKAYNGITMSGDNCVARGNRIRNVSFGIQSTGDNALVEYNEVINFSGDGMRGLGDYGVFQYNLVMNCYDVDGNHDDGFQSWSDGGSGSGSGVVYGIELRGNVFIESDDPTRAYNGALQGIGCFDGFYEDFVIENNLLIIDQWHGISLYGATNCTIANNTVVEQDVRTQRPWIAIYPHKNGTPSTGNNVVNNIARSFSVSGGTSSNNLVVTPANYATYFVDAANLDFSLVSGSPAIDAGTASGAPSVDIMGNARPQGSGYDVGAYEYAPAILIDGNGADTQAHDDGTSTWAGNQSVRVGGATNVLEGAMIYVFQLPALPVGETILDANLDFTLLSIANGTFPGEADLYGLPYRSTATVVASTDFYNGTYGGDVNATAIESGIMSNTQAAGTISTDATGDWNLAAYLADQYNNGAVGGDYVFIRVNSNQTDHLPYRYWQVATANHATVAYRPVLSVEIGH